MNLQALHWIKLENVLSIVQLITEFVIVCEQDENKTLSYLSKQVFESFKKKSFYFVLRIWYATAALFQHNCLLHDSASCCCRCWCSPSTRMSLDWLLFRSGLIVLWSFWVKYGCAHVLFESDLSIREINVCMSDSGRFCMTVWGWVQNVDPQSKTQRVNFAFQIIY